MNPTTARLLACLCLPTALGACGRTDPQPQVVTHETPVSAPPPSVVHAAPPSTLAPGTLARPAAKLVIAIGDLHGDLDATRRALRLAGVIDERDQWIGGDTVVVQTGDILDRGDGERAILDLTDKLRAEAAASGGAFVALSGNHELMNVAGDFRYVTPGGFAAFTGDGGRDVVFRPGGSFARRLAERPVVAQIGDTVYVHAGVLPKHVSYGLARMNDEVRAWMLGERPAPPEIMVAADGPIWTRVYSLDTHADGCALLTQALDQLGARRMVVGHTPQLTGITSACDERVWRIDTGMAKFYGGPVEVLELRGDVVKARQETPPTDTQ